MNQSLALQFRPLLHEGNNRVVPNEQQHRLARCKRLRRIDGRLAPTPPADRKTKQLKVVLKMTGKPAVADDADRRRLAGWYLSHGSGPSKRDRNRRKVAVVCPSAPQLS